MAGRAPVFGFLHPEGGVASSKLVTCYFLNRRTTHSWVGTPGSCGLVVERCHPTRGSGLF